MPPQFNVVSVSDKIKTRHEMFKTRREAFYRVINCE